ncbi:MAG TPA: DoxX family protein [Caulobacteraceae bacterium]|nr:DoxX family protein [Caulobacteraceae bacterium]
MPAFLFPTGLSRFHDLALLALRLFLGAFLIYGVWDNIASAARMAEFVDFLAKLNCPLPDLAARVSVWVQFVTGVLLIGGMFTRWAGLLLAANFVVAVALIAPTGASFRDLYPPTILVFIGLLLATTGAGRLSADAGLEARWSRPARP